MMALRIRILRARYGLTVSQAANLAEIIWGRADD